MKICSYITITRHPLILISPAPMLTQNCLEQVRVGAGRDTIDGIVTAHEGADIGVSGTAFEWREVVFY